MIYILKSSGYYFGEWLKVVRTPFPTLNEAVEAMRRSFESWKVEFARSLGDGEYFRECYDIALDDEQQCWASLSERRACIVHGDDHVDLEIQCDSRFSPAGNALSKSDTVQNAVVVSWWSRDIQAVCNAIPDVRVFESMEAGKAFLFALYAERLADSGLAINGARDGSGNPIPGGYVSEDGRFASVWDSTEDGPVTEVFAGSVQELALGA